MKLEFEEERPGERQSGDESQGLPNIPTDRVAGHIFQEGKMHSFWQGYRSWFKTFGIDLYELRQRHDWALYERWSAPPVSAHASPPFAIRLECTLTPPFGKTVMDKFGLAQDSLGHDLFIKLTDKDTDEHRINQYLLSLKGRPGHELSPNVLRPVAVLDSPHSFSFIVMPLWGPAFSVRDFTSVRLILVFIRCLLSGLLFLHDHRIAHRDIRETNVLVNGYSPDDHYCGWSAIGDHLQSPEVAFCLFDYDLAIQLPQDTSVKFCRLPSSEGHRGSFEYHPPDISLAEPEYNPFAFDVGCLGMMLLYFFADVIPIVPQLAPLFAKMTTHVVEQRFTASDAMSFFNDHLSQLSVEVLASSVVLDPNFDHLHDPNLYWSLLDIQSRSHWGDYRVPVRPWYNRVFRRLLRCIARTRMGWRFLSRVRRVLQM